MEIEFVSSWTASATKFSRDYFVLVSRLENDQLQLIEQEMVQIKGRVNPYLRKKISAPVLNNPIDARELRQNISPRWGQAMTEHLLSIFRFQGMYKQEVVENTAWCYENLVSWGESSAVRELAMDMKISSNTVKNRLQLARSRGLLTSPGSGSRLG